MFTGIIEEVGEIAEIADCGGFRTVRVRAHRILDGIQAGASISVNGVCLTARTIHNDGFTADLSHETLERTSLKVLATDPWPILNVRWCRRTIRWPYRARPRRWSRSNWEFTRKGDDYRLEVEFPNPHCVTWRRVRLGRRNQFDDCPGEAIRF